MTTACGCTTPEEPTQKPTGWWQDAAVVIPLGAGVALLAGLVLDWFVTGADLAATVLFWAALGLGASQFVPGALRGLFTAGRLGIGVLMTMSATGAVLLGFIEEAAALAFLYALVEALEDRAMAKARTGLRALLGLIPDTATVLINGMTITLPVAALQPGHRLRLTAGQRLATDATVVTGTSSLDVSALTGESIPVRARPGDPVAAGAINLSGTLELEATAAGTDNSLTAVVDLVEQAQYAKGQRARLADRLAKPLVPGVLVLAVLVAILGVTFGGDPGTWIEQALVVLVAASPCALAISVPVTVVSGIGAASRLGGVVKSGAAFERLGAVDLVAWDKTGTLTRNQPVVTDVITVPGVAQHDVVRWAAALETHSTHPLAHAITRAAGALPAARDVHEVAGQGMTGTVEGVTITVGNPDWLDPGPLAHDIIAWQHRGISVVVVHRQARPVGVIGVRDELRPEAAETIDTLSEAGISSAMLTGDNPHTARALAKLAAIDRVHAQLRPEHKAHTVTTLREDGTVAMVGDGINDAPALAAADVGIAMGANGSDAALESADVAFLGEDLRLIARLVHHARRGRRIMNQNVVVSLALIIALVPLALTGVLGLAAVVLVHEVAEVVIIINGLRAGRLKPLEGQKVPQLAASGTHADTRP